MAKRLCWLLFSAPSKEIPVTGAEFKTFVLIAGLAVLAPAVVVAFVRANERVSDPDKEYEFRTWWAGPVKVLLGFVVVAVFYTVKDWEDTASFAGMVGRSIAMSFAVSAHVVLILFIAKILQIWIKPTFRHIGFTIYVALFFLAAMFFNEVQKNAKQWISRHEAREVTQFVEQHPPKQAPSPGQADELQYAQTVGTIEAIYPELNPDSPRFNQAAVDRVLTRMRAHMSSGMTRSDALRTAANEVFGSRNPSPVTSPSRSAPPSYPTQEGRVIGRSAMPPGCEFKPVMTDADYRACGITPPR